MMVIPHSNNDVKQFRIPMLIVNLFALIGVISIVAVVYLSISYGQYLVTLKENKVLRQVNKSQALIIDSLKNQTLEIKNKLNDIKGTDSKIREIIGLSK